MALKRGLLRAEVSVRGEKLRYMPELLHRKGVNVYEFILKDDQNALITVDFLDLSKIFAICKNMCYNKKVVKYKGILSPFTALIKRAGFFIGSVLFLILTPILNNVILSVDVKGSGSCLADETKTIAYENGAQIFSTFSSLDYSALATKILTENSRLSFVTVEKQGNRLVINTVLSTSEPSVLGKNQVDLISSYDGKIEAITVLRGTPLVEVGSAVKKGDKLVGAYLTGKDGEFYETYVIARVKILQNYKYFYKCDIVNDISVSTAYALAEFNSDGEVVEKTHAVKEGGIEVTLTIRRTVYGGN